MFKEIRIVENMLRFIRGLIPRRVFRFFQPWYHGTLSLLGSYFYGQPSKKIKVIGVTGTKGKSTTVFLISKLLGEAGKSVAAIGSLGYRIKDRQWPNELKMTMPGRWKLQKFLYEAVKEKCEYVVLEVTSEGLAQNRHWGVKFDCAVFTNLSKEHLESHGSFSKYYQAKQRLFEKTKNIHVLNADDSHIELFSKFESSKKIFYGINHGDMKAVDTNVLSDRVEFEIYGTKFNINLGGEFNIYNCLAALSCVAMYGMDLPQSKAILEKVTNISGRMEFVHKNPDVIVDYAHTPDSLEKVYKTFREDTRFKIQGSRLICVLGAAGGGRDKWKRPEFGKIAEKYCDEIILTNEDPFDEDPYQILSEIKSGILTPRIQSSNFYEILDRKEAIKQALTLAGENDTVIITGKGSETSIAVSNGKKVPWSDKKIILELLKK
ncbi:MAG: UDP-N-acetylmuramoyl-L-alanyl-D-glutamate--2,6-diaminopimelate ligase [Parcubacteria group bacterium]|nr:UDP-N-acetylmuramoyl-L-alanyl-D-glutamate--2,6-diaminopimelate ligase [Parcubacteria group bacterium]